MDIKFVTINGKSIAEVSRHDLEELVNYSRLLRKFDKNNHEFDFYDIETIKRAQNNHHFLISELREFNPDQDIKFGGRKFRGEILSDDEIILSIKNLNHKTCARFAYAAYKLMLNNRIRYSDLIRKFPYNGIPPNIESYFKDKLQEYLEDAPKDL